MLRFNIFDGKGKWIHSISAGSLKGIAKALEILEREHNLNRETCRIVADCRKQIRGISS